MPIDLKRRTPVATIRATRRGGLRPLLPVLGTLLALEAAGCAEPEAEETVGRYDSSGVFTDVGAEADSAAPDGTDTGSPETGTADDAATTSDADTGIDHADVSPDVTPAEFEPSEPVMPRLTVAQYRNTLSDLFGPALPVFPLEADTSPYLFESIGAAQTVVSSAGVERYADAAFAIAAQVFRDPERRARVLDCEPASADDACAEQFVRNTGLRVLRRPITDDELQRWLSLSRDVAGTDPYLGLETVLAGLLQSTHFLYRIELGEPDPDREGLRRYTSYEMAQRLSFLLWNTAPDAELLEAAGRGELLDDVSIEREVRRMLASPRARDAVQDFFTQYLDLGRLGTIERDPTRYPGAGPSLFAAMETEMRLLVDEVVFRQNLDIRELFSAPRGYVNSELAALYGVDAPGATPVTFVPVDFPPELHRNGILTLGAFLTMNAHQTETSPTLRGKYLRERVLCTPVPPPPDDIDLNLEATEGEPPTLRERLEQHRSDPACAGCHSFIDPPGFLFEHFDSIGRYREFAEGHPIHAAGDLDGTPLTDSGELAAMLRDDMRVGRCVTRQLYRHANSRLETSDERDVLRDLHDEFAASDYRFQDLMLALALSEGFRVIAPPTTGDEVTP